MKVWIQSHDLIKDNNCVQYAILVSGKEYDLDPDVFTVTLSDNLLFKVKTSLGASPLQATLRWPVQIVWAVTASCCLGMRYEDPIVQGTRLCDDLDPRSKAYIAKFCFGYTGHFIVNLNWYDT